VTQVCRQKLALDVIEVPRGLNLTLAKLILGTDRHQGITSVSPPGKIEYGERKPEEKKIEKSAI
jgi:hypothetical protein